MADRFAVSRERLPIGGNVLPHAARTATVNSDDLGNLGARGVHVIVRVTAITAAPSLAVKIQGRHPSGAVGGTYYDLLVGTAITAAGTTVLKLGPGITAVAGAAAADYLPETWRVRVEAANADSATYEIDAVVLP